MTQRALDQRGGAEDLEEPHPEFPLDSERFALGLENDRKLRKAWLMAGLLSEAALAGMFVTAFEEPGRAWSVVLGVLMVGLALAMVIQLAQYRLNGKPRTQLGKRHRLMPAR
jgi:hypothetical protein